MARNRDRWRTTAVGIRSEGRAAVPHNGWREGVEPLVRPGCIIVRQRLPWRVLEINELPEDLWPEQWERRWQEMVDDWKVYEAARLAGEPEPWGAERKPRKPLVRAEWFTRPIVLVLQPVDEPKARPTHIFAPVNMEWQILPEHYAVCRLCGELPPCRHAETEATVDKAVQEAERLMAIPRGACMGCGKAITSRMKSERYPGPNLWCPNWGSDSAVFHLRNQDRDHSCTNASWRYRKQWEAEGLNALNSQPTIPEGPK